LGGIVLIKNLISKKTTKKKKKKRRTQINPRWAQKTIEQ